MTNNEIIYYMNHPEQVIFLSEDDQKIIYLALDIQESEEFDQQILDYEFGGVHPADQDLSIS